MGGVQWERRGGRARVPNLVRGGRLLLLAGLTVFLTGMPTPDDDALAQVAACSGYVALTFDDGPDNTNTPKVLDVLRDYGVVATFFVNGWKVERSHAIVARTHDEGHRVANHFWTHARMPNLSDAKIREGLERTYQEIYSAGAVPLRVYRPPYGDTNDRVRRVAARDGWVEVLWTVDPQDWRTGRSAAYIRDHVVKHSRANSNILLHDGVNNTPATIGALPGIISGLHAKGLCFGLLDATGRVVPVEFGAVNCGPETDVIFCDIGGSTFEEDIIWLAQEGITQGCNPPINNRFCPERGVTRGEMAVFLDRALSFPGTSTDYFNDDNGMFYEGSANRMAEAGITMGCNPPANDSFCGDRKITRGEMAALLARALDLADTSQDYFVDDSGSKFESEINRIAEAGITKGCNPPANDRYCPDANVTRSQLAAFIKRVLD